MKTYALMYFVGLFLLGMGLSLAMRQPSALPITMGSGLLLSGIVKYLEGSK